MSHSHHAEHVVLQTSSEEMTLEQLDRRNRSFHQLHDEVIANAVTRVLAKLFNNEGRVGIQD